MTDSPMPSALALDPEPFDLELVDEVEATGRLTPEQLDQYAEQMEPELVKALRWHVANDSDAEWALRMLASIEDELRAIDEQFALWYAKIAEAHKQARTRPAGRAGFFRSHLEAYGISRRRAEPKMTPTIALPSGEIGTKQPKKPTVELVDEDVALAWLAENVPEELYDTLVKVTTKLLILELRKWVKVIEQNEPPDPAGYQPPTTYAVVHPETGEVIPGTHAELGEPTASVKIR